MHLINNDYQLITVMENHSGSFTISWTPDLARFRESDHQTYMGYSISESVRKFYEDYVAGEARRDDVMVTFYGMKHIADPDRVYTYDEVINDYEFNKYGDWDEEEEEPPINAQEMFVSAVFKYSDYSAWENKDEFMYDTLNEERVWLDDILYPESSNASPVFIGGIIEPLSQKETTKFAERFAKAVKEECKSNGVSVLDGDRLLYINTYIIKWSHLK